MAVVEFDEELGARLVGFRLLCSHRKCNKHPLVRGAGEGGG